jgi:ATP-dependent Clp protease ATP-binding subunit ClpC
MYERLSKRTDKVIKLANEIAREYQQEYVGTEHILLAILQEGTGIGHQVMKDRGHDERKVRGVIDRLIKQSMEDTWVFGRLPGTPHFKNVVARAIEEAQTLRSKEVCTEHLLLGLLREQGSVAYNALAELNMKYDDVREDVHKLQQAATQT